MKPKINYSYTIRNHPLDSFEFIAYNDVVDEECYYHRVMPYLPKVIDTLKLTPNSRQVVIITHKQFENNACLLSVQFMIVKSKLIVIANFRSECRIKGRPNDERMLRYFATIVSRSLDLKKFKIHVNIANYHENLGEKNNYGHHEIT